MLLFDSHAHLNLPEFQADLAGVIERARTAGVTRMVNVGVDAESSRLARDLAREHEGLYASVAVHPNYVEQEGEEGARAVRALAEEGGFVAIGETGLDYFRDHSPPEGQRAAFREHIALADALSLPFIVHCRAAHEDCRTILAEEAERRDLDGRVIMHCFGGTAEDAAFYLDLGAVISFAGNVTFKNAHELREAAALVPLDRTLVETDCPYLAPQARRGKRNEPAYVAFAAVEIARIHGVDEDAAARITTRNACRIFGIEGES